MECLSTPTQLECDALLLCEESLHSLRTIGDPVLQTDRVMEQMLSQEDMVVINPNYMSTTQLGKVTESKRKDLVASMAMVCEQHAASLHIMPMAVSYLDRVLSCSRMREDELELTAMACVLIASKLNNCDGVQVEKLGHQFLFTSRQLLDMELLVLNKLKWDLYTITPYDFIDLLLPRLNLAEADRSKFYSVLEPLVQVCCLEYHFIVYPPSLIAAGCMVAAARLLGVENPSPRSQWPFREFLASVLNVEEEFIAACHEQIEDDYHISITCSSQSLPKIAGR